MNIEKIIHSLSKALIISGLIASHAHAEVIVGNDLNSASSTNSTIADIYSANRGANGGGDQSLQFGDIIEGTVENDLLIGGLGIDVLFGGEGDDIIIGGTEDFNRFNRDRAFGQAGDDVFLWAPGDGNDFFDGGPGDDVVFLSLIGESRRVVSETLGPVSLAPADESQLVAREAVGPIFSVNPPGREGSQDFDGIHEVAPGVPVVNFSASPGFCEIVERDANNKAGLDQLNIDHLVRFILRGPRARFIEDITLNDIAPEIIDDGLRVALHLKNVEFLVCSSEIASTNPRIFDLREVPAQEIDVSNLPVRAAELVKNSFSPEVIIAR